MHGKSYYETLTARVSKIDKSAARYMCKGAKKLKSFNYYDELNVCFVWAATSQGHDYWENIYNKLKEDM